MGRRALIIGIEDYTAVSDGSIAAKLDGTLNSAKQFRDWLIAKWDSEGVAPADRQLIFCSEPTIAGGRHAAAEDIGQALLDLKEAGQNATDELFFYFSGHGFSFVEPDARSDVLIASNYRSMQLSGSACMKLDKAIYWLRQHLGSGHQYYFVDACRNDLDGRKINPGGIVPPSDPQTSDEATTFLLQSTAPAATAAVDGKFAAALLDGLKGKSTAKIWDDAVDDTMIVRFDTLRGFVRSRMPTQRVHNNVEGSDGETDGVIVRFKPAPSSNCTVRIAGGGGVPAGTIVSTGKRNIIPIRRAIAGDVTTFALKPDRYTVAVEMTDGQIRDNDREVVIFEDTDLIFECEAPGTAAQLSVQESTTEIALPRNLTVKLQEWATGDQQIFRGIDKATLPHGRYAAIVLDGNDRILRSDELIVEAEKPLKIGDWSKSAPHASIAALFPNNNGSVFFSESIGPLDDPDLDVWLAVIGGGRIMRGSPYTDYSKIRGLPLHDFGQEIPGSSPVYVLAGLENPEAVLQIVVSNDASRAEWIAASQPGQMVGIRHALIRPDNGQVFVSLRLDDGPSYTIASLASPNRATLVTVTLDDDGLPIISQYLLPLGHLLPLLDPFVAERITGRNQLADLKMLAEASRAFRKRRDLQKNVTDSFLNDVLYAKWLDPIAAALAAYELIRRGRTAMLPEVVKNLTSYFPDLPDNAALAKLAGLETPPHPSVPLFLDGLRAFPGRENALPFAATNLDYNSAWTAWRGVL